DYYCLIWHNNDGFF
nr:immunoglobulin light chain junction region [Macaca mulatta]MOX74630.1 immunoglobulin light chain junction region [Macaca mulatta]